MIVKHGSKSLWAIYCSPSKNTQTSMRGQMKYYSFLIASSLLIVTPSTAQQISVFNGPNGPVATELSYPTENFYYLGNDVISAPKIGNYTVYNGPNGELLGSRVDGYAD